MGSLESRAAGLASAGVAARPRPEKRIWIDLDNTPHVPFFAPIIEELKRRGYSTTITTRDAFQVCELADLMHLDYKRVGHHYGKHKILKALGLCIRALRLLPIAVRERPCLALSHGSRSQLVACAVLGIPSLLMLDYEFAQALLAPTWTMAPEVIPDSAVPFANGRLLRYPGIKEDVYVPRFTPNPLIRRQLGLSEDHVVVLVRPPATEAHYHNPESELLLGAVVGFLVEHTNVRIVLLPRNSRQEAWLRDTWPELFMGGKSIIPQHAVEGLNLIWCSDLVISGGGTMNREAAALGVPVYSIFRGKIGAVDRHLADKGRLVLLETVEDVRTKILLHRRSKPSVPQIRESTSLQKIVNDIVTILEARQKPLQSETC